MALRAKFARVALIKPAHTYYKQGGFTLVELLVVMGIIAILVAISLGPITSALRASQTAKCSANMRQIGSALQEYLADHNNVMPQRYYADGTGYYAVVSPYAGSSLTDKSGSIFVCPSHTACSFPAEPSYGMNWYYDNTSALTVTSMSTTIMVAETAGPAGQGSNRADENSGDPGQLDPTRHGGWSNYLFFDGHVEKLQFASTTNLWGTDMGNHNLQTP